MSSDKSAEHEQESLETNEPPGDNDGQAEKRPTVEELTTASALDDSNEPTSEEAHTEGLHTEGLHTEGSRTEGSSEPDQVDRIEPAVGEGDADAATVEEIEVFDVTQVSQETTRALEGILMVADEPVTPQLLGELMEISPARIELICAHMAETYELEQRGFVLSRVSGGYRYQSHADLAGYVERFVLDGQAARLSQAAMETLAIVAYKQPISRAQVAAIRGVSVDGVMRTLVQRNYVAEVATDPGPGQATLFGTTQLFLQNLGLDSIKDLPPLGDLVPGAEVMEALEASLRIDSDSGRPVRGTMPTAEELAGEVADVANTDTSTSNPSISVESGAEAGEQQDVVEHHAVVESDTEVSGNHDVVEHQADGNGADADGNSDGNGADHDAAGSE